jgi:hypothetical protein
LLAAHLVSARAAEYVEKLLLASAPEFCHPALFITIRIRAVRVLEGV